MKIMSDVGWKVTRNGPTLAHPSRSISARTVPASIRFSKSSVVASTRESYRQGVGVHQERSTASVRPLVRCVQVTQARQVVIGRAAVRPIFVLQPLVRLIICNFFRQEPRIPIDSPPSCLIFTLAL